jgi:hypothetical protein
MLLVLCIRMNVLFSPNTARSLHQNECHGLGPIVASAAACTASAASQVSHEKEMRVKPNSEYSPQLCLHLRNTTQNQTERIKMNALKDDMRM